MHSNVGCCFNRKKGIVQAILQILTRLLLMYFHIFGEMHFLFVWVWWKDQYYISSLTFLIAFTVFPELKHSLSVFPLCVDHKGTLSAALMVFAALMYRVRSCCSSEPTSLFTSCFLNSLWGSFQSKNINIKNREYATGFKPSTSAGRQQAYMLLATELWPRVLTTADM